MSAKTQKGRICKAEGCEEPLKGRRADARYCSAVCYRRTNVAQKKAARKAARKAAKLAGPRVCLHCGEKIPEDRQASAKFCGHRCRNAYNYHLDRGRSRAEIEARLERERAEALADSIAQAKEREADALARFCGVKY